MSVATLPEHAELAGALSPNAGFLARFIDSVNLQRRWRVSRSSLRRYEAAKLIPAPKWAFGKYWYPVDAIRAAEWNLFGPAAGGNDAH